MPASTYFLVICQGRRNRLALRVRCRSGRQVRSACFAARDCRLSQGTDAARAMTTSLLFPSFVLSLSYRLWRQGDVAQGASLPVGASCHAGHACPHARLGHLLAGWHVGSPRSFPPFHDRFRASPNRGCRASDTPTAQGTRPSQPVNAICRPGLSRIMLWGQPTLD